MPDKSIDENLQARLHAVADDSDLFRIVIRTFAVIEDLLERQITLMLIEPLERLESAAFHHKLNLAVGLGIVAPETRAPLAALAKLRNQLAHGDREPETVTHAEGEALLHALDPDESIASREALRRWPPVNLVRAALLAGYLTIQAGGASARATRIRGHEALLREVAAERAASPLLRSVARRDLASAAAARPTTDMQASDSA